MRRWIADRMRLALRWALKRWCTQVVTFAFAPTKQEWDAITAKVIGQAIDHVLGGSTFAGVTKPEDRKKLH